MSSVRQLNAVFTAQATLLDTYLSQFPDGSWRCPSITDSRLSYHVRVELKEGRSVYRCSCPAGEHEHPCKHAAALWLKRVKRMRGWRIKYIPKPK